MMSIFSSCRDLISLGSFPLLTVSPLGPFGTQFGGSSSEQFVEILTTGFVHGFFFSLPFSIPMLICFRRYLLDGFSLGNYALAGTLLGHLSFVFCTLQGIRPIIHFWYPFEPLLSLLGLALSLKVAMDFFSQRRFAFEGTLGLNETSSTYGLNPWPKMPDLSWENLTGSPLPRPLDQFLTNLFFQISALKTRGQNVVPTQLKEFVQTFQNFCRTNLGPSFFSFQFVLMWLNPASASTLHLVFFEPDLLRDVFLAPNSPIFLLYSVGFLFSSSAFCGCLVFLISQLAGRSPLQFAGNNLGQKSFSFLALTQFNEALAQNRFKLFNKFFTFLIIGCVIQSGLNYTWRLFLQYPLELIHWEFFDAQKMVTTVRKNFGFEELENSGTTSIRGMNAPKEPFQKRKELSKPGPNLEAEPSKTFESELEKSRSSVSNFKSFSGPTSSVLNTGNEMGTGTAEFGFYLPSQSVDEMRSALSLFPSNLPRRDKTNLETSGVASNKASNSSERNASPQSKIDWLRIHSNPDFQGQSSLWNSPPGFAGSGPRTIFTGDSLSGDQSNTPPNDLKVVNFFGRREFPPYDTSIRNREKNLPVERHLAIERVNARRSLMGRPPLENEERENAIFKYHTFFMNQIDRSVEDFKMKLATPNDLYREEDDVLALQKLRENYLKQKGRDSDYQKSFLPRLQKETAKEVGFIPRHDRDFFTKSRPVTNTTKGFSKLSYIRDLFDEKLREAYSAYSHDDLVLESILK